MLCKLDSTEYARSFEPISTLPENIGLRFFATVRKAQNRAWLSHDSCHFTSFFFAQLYPLGFVSEQRKDRITEKYQGRVQLQSF